MASLVTKAGAWCNGEVAYLAWSVAAEIEGCLGFMITRVHETGGDAGARRILPTWIAFRDQSNPNWQNQDSSVWPIQAFEWRDLTLRKSRDTTAVRPIDFAVHYEIVPVGTGAPGRAPVPVADTAVHLDAAGQPRYVGTPRPLFTIGDPAVTPSIEVTHRYAGPDAAIEATFTNGILSTQNLLQQLRSARPQKPGEPADTTKGLLAELKSQIVDVKSPIRSFLTGDALSFLRRLLDRAAAEGGEVYLALYELTDPELVPLLEAGVRAKRIHLILSTAGSQDPNTKGTDRADRQPMIWDTENDAARLALQAIDAGAVRDRMFNGSGHIGHDKFAVYVKDGAAAAVMTGSTNWTPTGLCTQSNNVIIIEDATLAGIYLDFWHRLEADGQPARVPITVGKVSGAEPSHGVQGQKLRSSNKAPFGPVTLKDRASTVSAWFSPNTRAPSKTAASAMPGDLADVYGLMDHAKGAILFLSFMPGESGQQNIVGEARKVAESRPDLLVMGAVSDPAALPDYHRPEKGVDRVPPPTVWWPGGDRSRIAFIRATEIRTAVGDLRPELLSAGHAIIHDKIIVIDPLDEADCVVITGSHNLGYKASYANDENLLIIRGNRALAIAYAVHVMDVYDHYVTRAKLEDADQARAAASAAPAAPDVGHGFLATDASWQDRFFPVPPASALRYFLDAAAPATDASPVAAAATRKPPRPAADRDSAAPRPRRKRTSGQG